MADLQSKQATGRLFFIDVTRSISILLMLEGHFIVMWLDQQFKDKDEWAYSIMNDFDYSVYAVDGPHFANLQNELNESQFFLPGTKTRLDGCVGDLGEALASDDLDCFSRQYCLSSTMLCMVQYSLCTPVCSVPRSLTNYKATRNSAVRN